MGDRYAGGPFKSDSILSKWLCRRVCVRLIMATWPFISIRAGVSLPGCVPHHSLATTTTFDDGFKVQRARSCSLCVGYPHHSSESRERRMRHSPSSNRLCFRQCPLDLDKGMLPPIRCIQASGLRLFRTPWPTKRITSSSGKPAPVYVKPSTGV